MPLIFPIKIWHIIFENFSWMNDLSIHPLLELRKTCKYLRSIVDRYLKRKYNTTDILVAIRIACEWTVVKEYSEEHYYKNYLHDTFSGTPAIIGYRQSTQENMPKQVEIIRHYKLGKQHNDSGPAIKTYRRDGELLSIIWRNNGFDALGLSMVCYSSKKVMNLSITYACGLRVDYVWRSDGSLEYVHYKPAYLEVINNDISDLTDCEKEYYKHLKSSSSSSITINYYPDGITMMNEIYVLNGKSYRDDGPAISEWRADGTLDCIKFCNNGVLHNIKGPALLCYGKNNILLSKEWFINGKRYREKGPVTIRYYTNGNLKCKHYINGTEQVYVEYNEDGKMICKYST